MAGVRGAWRGGFCRIGGHGVGVRAAIEGEDGREPAPSQAAHWRGGRGISWCLCFVVNLGVQLQFSCVSCCVSSARSCFANARRALGSFRIRLMVILAEKQLLAAVAPRHDMVYGARILESQLPCHAPTKLQKTPESTPNSNFEGLTPWQPAKSTPMPPSTQALLCPFLSPLRHLISRFVAHPADYGITWPELGHQFDFAVLIFRYSLVFPRVPS